MKKTVLVLCAIGMLFCRPAHGMKRTLENPKHPGPKRRKVVKTIKLSTKDLTAEKIKQLTELVKNENVFCNIALTITPSVKEKPFALYHQHFNQLLYTQRKHLHITSLHISTGTLAILKPNICL